MPTRRQVAAPREHKAAVPVARKQHKAAVPPAEGNNNNNNNRRALGDIGNLVNLRPNDGKQLPQITRPVTRSFGAQLLLNAQVAAEASAAAAAAKKPTKQQEEEKKEKVKEKLEEVVVATKPKQEEEVFNNLGSSTKKLKPRSRVHTLTSVLTARSKAACEITADKQQPKEPPPPSPVHDIDGPDAEDQLAVADYVEDIYTFYRTAESQNRPSSKYMDSQVEINGKMRSILADWLIEVHHKFELMPETLYLTMHIIDRYLSMEVVLRRELQLVGVSAMLIACKYEEIWAPEVNDFICISDRAYSRGQVLAMEKNILNKMEWNLTVPTPYVFLVRFIKASLGNKEMENMVFFFAELGLLYYSMVGYSPSKFAAAAVYVARCTLNKRPTWTEMLKHHTGYEEGELLECAKQLAGFHSTAAESKFKVVHKKYLSPHRCAVALKPPALELFLEGVECRKQQQRVKGECVLKNLSSIS